MNLRCCLEKEHADRRIRKQTETMSSELRPHGGQPHGCRQCIIGVGVGLPWKSKGASVPEKTCLVSASEGDRKNKNKDKSGLGKVGRPS